MLIVEIEGKEYELPESYDELMVGKFIEFYKLLQSIKEETLENRIRIIAFLMECNVEDIEKMDLNDIAELANHIAWTELSPTIEENFKRTFELVNTSNEVVRYSFSKNDRLKGEEVITMEHLLKDVKDNTLVFAEILAILLRPSIEKKNIETGIIEYEQLELEDNMDSITNRANFLKERLSIGDVYSGLYFFLNGEKTSSMNNTGTSSTLKIRKKVNS